MNEEQKAKLIAEAENIEAIRDFLTEWYSVADLYETAAKATSVMLRLICHGSHNAAIDPEERKSLQDLIEQHLMMIDLIKPFEGKEGEV